MHFHRNNPMEKSLNQVFNEIFNGFPNTWGRDVADGFNLPTNVHETTDGYHLEMLAAGRDKADFKIAVDKGLLTISYEKKEEAKNEDVKTLRREFKLASFKRSFSVDENVNTEDIQAKYENGVLKLYLPKKAEVKTPAKEVNIQ